MKDHKRNAAIPPPSLIFENGSIHTLDDRDTVVSSLAVSGDRVVWVGDAYEGPRGNAGVFDLKGRTVLPGFTDAHTHLVAYSVGLSRIDLRQYDSLDAALEAVGRRAASASEGEWVLGRGWVFRGWGLSAFPDRSLLDRVAPDTPVALVTMDGHVMWANSAALKIAGIDKDTPDPKGGEIERRADGEPTGILKENAADAMKEIIPIDPPDKLAASVKKGQAHFHALGITSVHNLERKKALRAFHRLHQRNGLKLRIRYFIADEEIDAAVSLGVEAGFGDDRLRITGVKAYADGSLLSETAFMLAPYGKAGARGIPVTEPEALEALIQKSGTLRLPVVVHAIGDAANRRVLDAFEKAMTTTAFPYRIEHAQHLDPADLPRFASLGVVASIQPIHLSFDLDQVERALGDRAPGAYRLRSLLDSGARIAFGSDAPIADPNPWLGVQAAVNRVRFDGTPTGGWYPEEKITVEEAIRAYTRTPAEIVGDGAQRGTLEPGKIADFCVLDRDPYTIPPETLKDVKIDLTVFDGEIVFDRMQPSR
ncbi:MAG: amidohydrolase [Planctomycetota bacterium]